MALSYWNHKFSTLYNCLDHVYNTTASIFKKALPNLATDLEFSSGSDFVWINLLVDFRDPNATILLIYVAI